VTLPEEVRALLKAFRAFLEEQGIAVSDRRWRKIVYLLQVSAWSHGRTEVSVWDAWLLQHCTWEEPEEREPIFKWYQERLGTASAAEPERLNRLVAALEKQLQNEKQSRSQARDDEGRLLFMDEKNQAVPEQKVRRRKVNKENEPLFLMPSEFGGDRTRGGKGLTQEEVHNVYRNNYGYGSGTQAQQYIADASNAFYENATNLPLMEPTRYSKAHIEARVQSVDALSSELSSYTHGLDEQIASVTTVVDEHLWIAPGFSKPARANLEQRRGQAIQLQARLKMLHTEFLGLPRSKE